MRCYGEMEGINAKVASPSSFRLTFLVVLSFFQNRITFNLSTHDVSIGDKKARTSLPSALSAMEEGLWCARRVMERGLEILEVFSDAPRRLSFVRNGRAANLSQGSRRACGKKGK